MSYVRPGKLVEGENRFLIDPVERIECDYSEKFKIIQIWSTEYL
jgi:hypothetical protein